MWITSSGELTADVPFSYMTGICVPPTCIEIMLILFYWIVLQLGGLTLLAMGIWVSVDGGSFLNLLGPFSNQATQFVNVGFFCIAVGAVLVLLGLLGCCGAHKESKCLLLTVGVRNTWVYTLMQTDVDAVVVVDFTNVSTTAGKISASSQTWFS